MQNIPNHQPFPKRKDIRLKGWNYSNASAYHVTVCTVNKAKLFGRIIDKGFLATGATPEGDDASFKSAYVDLSIFGKLCFEALEETASALVGCAIDTFVIMPNHVHLLISIEDCAQTSVGKIVGKFKSLTTKKVRRIDPKANVWQRGYYDHIIRNENDYKNTWEYIMSNPAKWIEDEYYV